jgi:hypothetical protein
MDWRIAPHSELLCAFDLVQARSSGELTEILRYAVVLPLPRYAHNIGMLSIERLRVERQTFPV